MITLHCLDQPGSDIIRRPRANEPSVEEET